MDEPVTEIRLLKQKFTITEKIVQLYIKEDENSHKAHLSGC